jgi:hypothetical protein
MKRSLLVACAIAGICAISCAGLSRHEPSFAGRDLHRWLSDLSEDHPEEVRSQARFAVRHIGTNALPYLIHCVSIREPAWQRRADKLLARARFGPLFEHRGYELSRCGLGGFSALGQMGSPALPALTTLSLDPATAFDASLALGAVSLEALPILMTNLTNESPRIRCAATYGLMVMETNAAGSQSLLFALTCDPHTEVRACAYEALGFVCTSPDVVPLLARGLRDTNDEVRMMAAIAIGKFGKEATRALPDLEQACGDSCELVARHARISIGLIGAAVTNNAEAAKL